MKRYIPFLIVGILIISGFGTFTLGEGNETDEKTIKMTFSQPYITEKNDYINIEIEGANSVLLEPGKAILPVCKQTLTFPLGTKIINVKLNILSDIENLELSKKIETASQAVHPGIEGDLNLVSDDEEQFFNSEEIYPSKWFEYDTGSGIKEDEHVLFLIYQLYPIRYTYSKDTIHYISSAEIIITYQQPETPIVFNDEYDLLIITPSNFASTLESLKTHKEKHGVRTNIVTLDEIYEGSIFSVEGRDEPEQIKYFIKNALETWGMKYVLLVGGRKPGIAENWYLPVRYVHIFWVDETQYMSDLYYADIYDKDQNFSTWDTDENNIFGEWNRIGSLKDEMDLYPDLYVGRWAVKNSFELQAMIRKTIYYENNPAEKKVVVVGGDNYEDPGIEGEIVGNKTLSILTGFESEKVYASETDVNPGNIRKALGLGAMFMHFHGHGSPYRWTTHDPGNYEEWEKGINVFNYPFFFNFKSPIVLFGGCHTAMFNVSIFNYPWSPLPIPSDLSWALNKKFFGGSIATLGYTCFPVASPGETGDLDGDGVNEPDCVESGYAYMQLGLFEGYSTAGEENLGDCWGYTVSRYIEHYKLPYQRWHIHTIHGFVLLGDPSLKIGGY